MNYTELKRQIDARPLSGLQYGVIAICLLLNMLDGMDVLAIAYAAPLIMDEWGVSARHFGMVFSAALVGMALGAALISPLADTHGRRRLVMIATLLIAVGMMLTAVSQTPLQLAGLRLLTGLGIGAMLASLTSQAAEYASARRRNLVVGLVLSGYPIGATLAGLVAAPLLPELGWRPMFLAAGSLSLFMLPLVYFLMPESLAFLTKRQPSGALPVMNRILARMRLPQSATLPRLDEIVLEDTRVTGLFQPSRASSTAWLWTAFFMSFLSLYFLLSWVPKLVVNAGLALDQAIYAGALFNFGAVFGITLLGYFSERFGLRRLIVLFFLATVVLMLIFGRLEAPLSFMLLETFLLGFFMQGGFVGLYAVAARLYPMELRTTGVGWAIGAGRTGAIIGPYIGGLTIAMGWSITANFTIFALPCLLAAVAAHLIRSPELD